MCTTPQLAASWFNAVAVTQNRSPPVSVFQFIYPEVVLLQTDFLTFRSA